MDRSEGTFDHVEGSSCIQLTDLPSALLITILAAITDPVHVAFILCTCRQFRSLVGHVPFQLKLQQPENKISIGDGLSRSGYAAQPVGSWERAALAGIRLEMISTRSLDLSGCSISDSDVACVLADLKLEYLYLDGCQKLTSSVADTLALHVRSAPRSVSLQRCFRIGPAAAGNLIVAAGIDGSQLDCILLSHLDKLNFPGDFSIVESSIGDIREIDELLPSLRYTDHRLGAGLRTLALHNCESIGTFELAILATSCPSLIVVSLGGSFHGLGLGIREDHHDDVVASAVSSLLRMSCLLKGLHILELTFFTVHVIELLRKHIRRGVCVWDLSDRTSVAEAANFTETLECNDGAKLALSAAVHCSDIRRKTPLHIAAIANDENMTADLLIINPKAVGWKDSAGATALFVAAECGYAAVCKQLLKRCADVLVSNRSGETPIYIAALRGHEEAVSVMLSFCQVHNVNWQDAAMYCDGWTPLMAAAVADRQEVAKVLFQAIGYDRDLSNYADVDSKVCTKLLDAKNRYGQTALHIASRRASTWFVTSLLQAGASASIRDQYGMRAIDTARKHGHTGVANILKQWEQHRKHHQVRLHEK